VLPAAQLVEIVVRGALVGCPRGFVESPVRIVDGPAALDWLTGV
jgi:hypothetical protein